MEDKRRDLRMLAAACAAALLVVAVLVLLFLSGRSGRKHDEIVLPESRPAQEQEDPPREEESVLTVTADNVQTVLQSMVQHYLVGLVYAALAEAYASENRARMTAMDSRMVR